MVKDGENEDILEEAPPPELPRRSFKKILLMVVPVVLALLGGGGWLFTSGRLAPLLDHGSAETPAGPPPPADRFYYDLPELLVDLRASGQGEVYLKLRAALELERAGDQSLMDEDLPVITDGFEVHLRELRVEDLKTPASMDALRSELLTELNARLKPVVIKDILFKEMTITMGR